MSGDKRFAIPQGIFHLIWKISLRQSDICWKFLILICEVHCDWLICGESCIIVLSATLFWFLFSENIYAQLNVISLCVFPQRSISEIQDRYFNLFQPALIKDSY